MLTPVEHNRPFRMVGHGHHVQASLTEQFAFGRILKLRIISTRTLRIRRMQEDR